MGLFSRVFGKGDQMSDEKAAQELKQIKAGEISAIYPILKPGDWVGIEKGALKQTLIGTPEEPTIVVGFGYDAPTNFVFLMPQDLEGKDPQKMLQDAYENLEQISIEFEPLLNGQILTASGHNFSSEKILCENHMMKAHELLQSKELYVSIPRRKCMMITSRKADKDLFDSFYALHNKMWEDESYGNAPIFKGLFVVVDGKINSVLA